MKSKKTTRRALLTSMLSLLICVSMLVGSTFAWFTDSVTSANNIIQSGNLDIELEYSKDMSSGSWKSVEGQSDLFSTELWEPGHTEVVYLRISNLGTLALKYQLSMIFEETPGINKEDKSFLLSQYLKFDVVEDVTAAYANRDAARDAVDGTAQALAEYSASGYMEAKADAKTVALVVYMPEEVGNEANYKTGTAAPVINLGINLFATQMEAEWDSFGPDYDKGAPWTGNAKTDWYFENPNATEFTIDTAEELAGLAALVNGTATAPVTTFATDGASPVQDNFKGKTIKLVGNVDLKNCRWTPIGNSSNGFCGTFDGQNYTISNLYVKEENNAGLFGYALNGGNVKNLKVKGARIEAHDYAGAIMGRGYTDIDNCHVEDAVVIATPYQMADGTYDGGAKAGGIIGQLLEGSGITVTNCSATNVKIYAFRDLGGVVGMVHNNNSASGNTASNVTLGYLIYPITADENENAGAIYGRVQSSATVFPAKDSAENQDYTGVYAVCDAVSLTAFASAVNAADKPEYEGETFAGKTVVLLDDIDLGGAEWDPIGNFGNSSKQFAGTFDGQGHIVSNFKITKKTADRAGKNRSPHGFFGNVNGTVKNLTIKDANLTVTDDGRYAGLLVGRLNGGLVENCHVIDSYAEIDYWQIGGLVGILNAGTIRDCSVEGTTVVGPAAVGAVVGIKAGADEVTIQGCTVKNCTVSQKGGFGGSYDDMFGAVVACVYSSNSVVSINNCTVTGTTVKGEAADKLYGYIAEGAKVYIDGVLVVLPKVVQYNGSIGFQEALGSLKSGDTLLIAGGTYETSGTFAVPAGVTIEGKEGETVIIRQNSAGQDDIFNCAGDVTIVNITFESNRKGYAITDNTKNHDTNGNITVRNCKFVGIATEKNYGVYKNLNGNLTIENCTFENYNNAICGVNNGNGSTTTITGCTFTNINGEAIGYVTSTLPANFEAEVIANNTGLTAENVIGY